MYIRSSIKYGKQIKIIHPGEYYISKEDELIGTLLGSCVSVCLHDNVKGISGMNHFMLPGRILKDDIFSDITARYGISAINKLLHDMIGHGAKRKNLMAKIFGGGHILDTPGRKNNIPIDNVRLAKIMMEVEDIPIVHEDVGNRYTRKLLFDVHTGKVFLKRTTKEDVADVVCKREKEYVARSLKDGKN